MDLENILTEYGKSHRLGRLQLDASGLCTLLINDHYLITFEKSLDKEGFYIYASIGQIPLEKEEEISLIALKGNLFGKETGRANIGYVEATRTLVLFEYFEHQHLDYPTFFHRFNQFTQYLFYWVVKLDSIIHQKDLLDKSLKNHDHTNKKIFYA